MNITFYRKGFANNSSSSHSLIFTKEDLSRKTDEDAEFGWDYFTCADKEAKENYLLICLRESWKGWANIRSDGLDYKEMERFKDNQFEMWLGAMIPELLNANTRLLNRFNHVDHQSIFTFPCYRDLRGINVDFARAIINEITSKNYAFLGGNDNDDNEHSFKHLDTDKNKAVKTLWRHLRELDPRSLLCERDEKTGEFIVSRRDGDIMKVNFE